MYALFSRIVARFEAEERGGTQLQGGKDKRALLQSRPLLRGEKGTAYWVKMPIISKPGQPPFRQTQNSPGNKRVNGRTALFLPARADGIIGRRLDKDRVENANLCLLRVLICSSNKANFARLWIVTGAHRNGS